MYVLLNICVIKYCKNDVMTMYEDLSHTQLFWPYVQRRQSTWHRHSYFLSFLCVFWMIKRMRLLFTHIRCIGFSFMYQIYALCVETLTLTDTHTRTSFYLHGCTAAAAACSFIQIVCFQKEYNIHHRHTHISPNKVKYFLLQQLSQT